MVCNYEINIFLIIHRYDIYFNRAAPTLVSAATSATLAPSASPMGSVKAFILAGLLRVITATCTVQCVQYSTVRYSTATATSPSRSWWRLTRLPEVEQLRDWRHRGGRLEDRSLLLHTRMFIFAILATLSLLTGHCCQPRITTADDGEMFFGPTRSFSI